MSQKMQEIIPVSAIICEFDPLHLGHEHILRAARRNGGAICCVMSGNFVQRGAPAILDKWSRARLALECGADLVAELPLSWACSTAERFAAGGVAIANGLGAQRLYFGSENADASRLASVAGALLSPGFSRALEAQPEGLGFAARRQLAVSSLLGPEAAELLSMPNANLGVEYIKAIKRQKAALLPVPIPRLGAAHGQNTDTGFRSASQLRELIRAHRPLGGLVPIATLRELDSARLEGRCPADISHLERAILYSLRSMPPEELQKLPDLSEGLENRLFRAVRTARSLEELYQLAKSRRYSHARVRRLVMAAFLGLRAPLPELPPYIRLLGLTKLGGQVLRQLQGSMPVIGRPRDAEKLPPKARETFLEEARADDIYALSCPIPQPAGRGFTEPVIRLP